MVKLLWTHKAQPSERFVFFTSASTSNKTILSVRGHCMTRWRDNSKLANQASTLLPFVVKKKKNETIKKTFTWSPIRPCAMQCPLPHSSAVNWRSIFHSPSLNSLVTLIFISAPWKTCDPIKDSLPPYRPGINKARPLYCLLHHCR